MQQLIHAIDSEHVAANSRALTEFVQANEASDSAMVRVLPKSSAEFRKMKWVPANLKAAHCLPESWNGFATPWMVHNAAASHRYGACEWPLVGCGQFLHCMEGKAILVCWPIAWTASVNVAHEDAMTFLGRLQAAPGSRLQDECTSLQAPVCRWRAPASS